MPVGWVNVSGPAAPTGGAGAHDSLRAVLTYTGSVIVDSACVRLPLTRADLGPDGLVADQEARTRATQSPRRTGESRRSLDRRVPSGLGGGHGEGDDVALEIASEGEPLSPRHGGGLAQDRRPRLLDRAHRCVEVIDVDEQLVSRPRPGLGSRKHPRGGLRGDRQLAASTSQTNETRGAVLSR